MASAGGRECESESREHRATIAELASDVPKRASPIAHTTGSLPQRSPALPCAVVRTVVVGTVQRARALNSSWTVNLEQSVQATVTYLMPDSDTALRSPQRPDEPDG